MPYACRNIVLLIIASMELRIFAVNARLSGINLAIDTSIYDLAELAVSMPACMQDASKPIFYHFFINHTILYSRTAASGTLHLLVTLVKIHAP